MPYNNANGQTVVRRAAHSHAEVIRRGIEALQNEITKLEAIRDSAVAQATTAEAAELARVALQGEIDKVQAQLNHERELLEIETNNESP